MLNRKMGQEPVRPISIMRYSCEKLNSREFRGEGSASICATTPTCSDPATNSIAPIFMPSLSIALATYNGEQHLKAQLESISNQTTAPSELIVADDGSSDRTIPLLRAFADQAPFPVRIIQNETRLGYRRNFMRAAATCNSDLIAFCDQDDVWDRNKLDIMQNAFDDPRVVLAFHNATLINEVGAGHRRMFRARNAQTFAPLAMPPWKIIPGFAQVIRRSLLRLTSLHAHSIDPYVPNELMPHDLWYPFWASVLGDIAYIPDRLAQYRQHRANASGWPSHAVAFVLDQIRNAEAYVGGNAIAAKNRLELLRRSRDLAGADEIARIDAAIRHYQALCIETDQRLAVYKGNTPAARTRALLSLLRQRAYTNPVSNSLGLDALLLDAFIGIPFARLVRSQPTPPQLTS